MSSDANTNPTSQIEPTKPYLHFLLLLPFIALLWLPFYNFTKPAFLGFPFFYWYQLLWVPLTSVIIYIVYKGTQ